MRGFRARDADRDRFVELIEAAHLDGQLGDADRDLRVSRARSATTLDDLETLTRDLRRPAGFVPTPAPVRAPVRERFGSALLIAVAVVVVAGGLGAVALVGLAAGPSVESSGPVVASEQAGGVEESEASSFAMTPAQVRRFTKAYERKFGTLQAFEVGFHPERVGVQVPVRGSRPRMERWSWDGRWRQDTQAARVAGPYRRVDLGAVDVRRLFANIATARRTLDVEKGRFTHALLIRWGEGPTELNIYIGNELDESGYLSSTPAGTITRRIPYSP